MPPRSPTLSDSRPKQGRKGRSILAPPPTSGLPPEFPIGGSRQNPAEWEPGRRRAELGNGEARLQRNRPRPRGKPGGSSWGPRMTHCAFPVGTQTTRRDHPLCCPPGPQGFVQDSWFLSHWHPERSVCPFVSGHKAWPGAPSPWALSFCFAQGGGTLGVHYLQDPNPPGGKVAGGVHAKRKGSFPPQREGSPLSRSQGRWVSLRARPLLADGIQRPQCPVRGHRRQTCRLGSACLSEPTL